MLDSNVQDQDNRTRYVNMANIQKSISVIDVILKISHV